MKLMHNKVYFDNNKVNNGLVIPWVIFIFLKKTIDSKRLGIAV